jgi:hypothetical protein
MANRELQQNNGEKETTMQLYSNPLKNTPTDPRQDENPAETTSISGINEALSYLSITMNLASSQTILASLQTLVETVMQHPNSEHFSDKQMDLLNRLHDDVRFCIYFNASDAHATETSPAKLLLLTLNLKDGNLFTQIPAKLLIYVRKFPLIN